MHRLGALGLIALALALGAPSVASADVFRLGTNDLSPAGFGQGCNAGCTSKVYAQNTTTESGVLTTAPNDGTITAWRVTNKPGSGTGTFRLRLLRPVGAQFLSVGRSQPATDVNGGVNATNLPIRVGDRIGVEINEDLGNSFDFFGIDRTNSGGTTMQFDPGFDDGETATPSAAADGRLKLNADAEFTPAQQPGSGGGGGGTTPAAKDTVKPAITLLTLAPARFQAANTGPGIIAAVGTQVVYALSEAAAMRFTVERAAKGRRSRGKCRKPTRKNRRGRRCTRYVKLKGSLVHNGRAGLNRFRFMGRLRGRQLRPGKYRLVGSAIDGAGNRSKTRRRSFRIVR